VVGDVMLDQNLWGQVRRISPEAPVPVVELERETAEPGGAANNAANAAAVGACAMLGGVVGDDAEGVRLRTLLVARNVDASGLVTEPGRPTTTKTRVVAHNQQVVRVDRERTSAITSDSEAALLRWVEGHLRGVGACIISDYAKGVVTSSLAQGIIGAARSAGVPVVVDPKGTDYARYRGAAVVTPNLHEAELASRRTARTDAELADVAAQLSAELDGAALLVTRGAAGMSLFAPGAAAVHVRAEAHQVYDVTGAGDTAITFLALALAAGAPLPAAMRLANRAAGVVVGKVGTATVTLDELRAAR
ncbi:MAG TPA: D-glycero-beta-D-manno-heptose-7-phosphate kinase, partial [Gemmatimonadales bacterium]|nr:D-glycero-beta-D-manno-heptose-7-phosphate kinase [Gemmatimonadales bacterium]